MSEISDPRSMLYQLKQVEKQAEKKFRLERDSNP